jgi:hypothetical protein
VKKEGIPVCPECGGPMHLERSAYGRTWECDRGRDLRSRCAGLIRIEDREPLTDLQLAEAMALRSFGGSKDRAKDQASYRRLVTSLRELEASPYLSSPEREGLAEARGTVERLAKAAALAKDRAKRQEKAAEAEREARYREAAGLLAMSYPFDPNRLEATVIDLLALDRYTHADWLIQPESVEGFADRLRRRAAPEQSPMDLLLRELASQQEQVRAHVARDWAGSAEPLADLSARLAERLPALREAILAAPPMLLLGARHVLDDGVPPKVVRLPVRQSP